VETIQSTSKIVRLVTHSIPSFSVQRAVVRLDEISPGIISSVDYLHPAKDPLYAVMVMDWLKK
jgi:hypothetical protein